ASSESASSRFPFSVCLFDSACFSLLCTPSLTRHYPLSLHDALPISPSPTAAPSRVPVLLPRSSRPNRAIAEPAAAKRRSEGNGIHAAAMATAADSPITTSSHIGLETHHQPEPTSGRTNSARCGTADTTSATHPSPPMRTMTTLMCHTYTCIPNPLPHAMSRRQNCARRIRAAGTASAPVLCSTLGLSSGSGLRSGPASAALPPAPVSIAVSLLWTSRSPQICTTPSRTRAPVGGLRLTSMFGL